jgi:hypothetical protein
VQAGPNEVLSVTAWFEDWPGLFPDHRHIVEHEDYETLPLMNVVPEPSVALGLGSGLGVRLWLVRRRIARMQEVDNR